MIDWLFSGIWWIDALRVFGIAFVALLVFGIPLWMLASKLHWRRKDAADVALHAERINAFKNAEAVTR